ncbi:hypothetical protein [Roseomonas elaeocarpi]|uniref:Beta-lactamase-related domain-containing protein n=1 Tax=Roseomonas elaeocarpi TaxID=907779 RepID=A0ABV6JU63_9PROT
MLLGLLLVLLASSVARSQDVPTAESLRGKTMQELGAQQDVAPMLRNVARGRQQVIFDHLRAPGEGVQVKDGYAWAWGCNGGNCRENGLLIGYEPADALFWMVLIRDGELDRQVPPRGSPWPAPLAAAVSAIDPTIGERLASGR